jgi:hypothetical protein
MIRFVLLCFGAVFLFVSSAQAHGVHGDCRVGDSWMGVVPHFHPGGYGQAIACGGGGGGGGYGRGYREPGYGGSGGGHPHGPGHGNLAPQGVPLGRGPEFGCPPGQMRYSRAGCIQ